MSNKIGREKKKSTVTALIAFVLFVAMVVMQFQLSATMVQAKTYDFSGTWKMTKKQSNGKKMKSTLDMGWWNTGVEGYFEIEVEGLYGVHHMDCYEGGSVTKIGTNKWRGEDIFTGANVIFKIKKNQIVVKFRGGNTNGLWNDVPSGTYKLKKRS